MTINEKLSAYAERACARFHMPGSKGRYPLCGSLDVTELPQTFDLYAKSAENEYVYRRTASRFGADMTLYSCAGATLAIQTAVFRCAKNSKMLVSQVHKSVSFAMALCSVEPVYFNTGDDISALADGVSAVFVTSEDYYGNIFPETLREYSRICREKKIPLICDNSHGSHLAFYGNGELHPLANGADVVIDSAHKTLPALTGGAFLHLTGEYARDWRGFVDAMEVFGSSSPSYLIAASLEYAADYMAEHKDDLVRLKTRLDAMRGKLSSHGYSFIKNGDPFRLTVFAGNAKEIDGVLEKNDIISEFSDDNAIVLIPSLFNTSQELDALEACLMSCNVERIPAPTPARENHVPAVNPHEALFSDDVDPTVARRPEYKYPPGIAVVQIGEHLPEK